MNLRLVVILLLSLLLSTSSFSLVNRLNALLASTEYKLDPQRFSEQYLLSLKLALPAAQYLQLKELEYGSVTWRVLAEKLARNDADIAWQLAQFYQSRQYERDHQYWFSKSVELGSADALIEKIKLDLERQPNKVQYLTAKKLLSSLLNINEDALILSSHLAIEYDDLAQLKLNLQKLTSVQGRSLQNLIKRYQLFALDDVSFLKSSDSQASNLVFSNENKQPVKHLTCANKLQFFATSIDALLQLEEQLEAISKDTFYLKQFCFATPRFISKTELNCSHGQDERIQCDESIWQAKDIAPDVKYLGVLVEQGGANVNHGILYIDQHDSEQVIEHELMHLIGFIDEYPLHARHNACARQKSMALANNILLSHDEYFDNEQQARELLLKKLPWRDLIPADIPLTTPVHINNRVKYKIGTPTSYKHEVGLFPANTCNKQGLLTFKPLSSPTKLEYFEETLPKEYKNLSLKAVDDFNMPSYQYNIGLSLMNQSKPREAKQWFKQSGLLEQNKERQQLITQGGF